MRAAAAVGLFLVTLSFSQWFLAHVPIAPAEEHFRLGERLHDDGIFSLTGEPSVFRPPGFPVFVAAVLHARDVLAPGLDSARAVARAHGWLLAFAAVALFLHAARERPLMASLGAGALVALHPLNLAIASVLTYATLHIVCVTVATLALCRAFDSPRHRATWALIAGALWGATTLVRPMSLILPPFVLLLARWTFGKGSGRRALGFAALFTLGMVLVIAPQAVRNYRLTGRVIPVNAQDGFQLWGLSATRNPGGGGGEWVARWRGEGVSLFARGTGGTPYSVDALYAHTVAANDAFRAEAVRNIRDHPGRFARNVLANLYLFNADSMAWWIDDLRLPGPGKAVTVAVLFLGALGLIRGLRDGRTDARVIATVYVMFAAAHSVAFLLPRYNYVRLPLILMAVPMALPGRGGIMLAVALAASAASVAEIPPAHGFRRFVSTLARNQAIDCGRGGNCADSPVTRAQMAVFLIASREDTGYAPPSCVTPRFSDVPCSNPFAPWINELAARRVTGGCGGADYCPDSPVSREQMAVFLLRAREAPGYSPPPCSAPAFGDVPCSSPYARWISELVERGITDGCGGGKYCPLSAVTRTQMAVFLVRAFGLN
jgi:hypothetical protein